jgi:hypothetical protein
VSNKKQGQHGREYWTKLVGEFGAAGLSQRAFCGRHGVRESALRYWLYLLRKEAQKEAKLAERFVHVTPAKTTIEPSGLMCTIRIGSVELTFSRLPPTDYVGELVRLMDR